MKRLLLTLIVTAFYMLAAAQCNHQCHKACGANEARVDSINIPVYIVDGVEVQADKLMELSPDDIIRIDIVKDSAVCQIFAPRTGGVFKITTKSKTLLKKAIATYEAQQKEMLNRNDVIMIR